MVSELPCCAFMYESYQDANVTHNVLGIACSWPSLCNEFYRQGPPCPGRNIIHFKTISQVGPKLFAADLDNLKAGADVLSVVDCDMATRVVPIANKVVNILFILINLVDKMVSTNAAFSHGLFQGCVLVFLMLHSEIEGMDNR